jgi:hypothetical protein
MPRYPVLVGVTMLLAVASVGVRAADFMPRVGGSSIAAVADDPAPRAASAAMSEPDSDAPARAFATPSAAVAVPHAAARIGVDDVVADPVHAAKAGSEDDHAAVPAPAHKGRTLRWQSLLPGVMK